MKKIGILTFHRSINTGAFMQCYGLVNQLQKDFPDCEIRVIDYETKTAHLNYSSNLLTYLKNGLSFSGVKNKIKSCFIFTIRFLSLVFLHPHRLKDRRNNLKIFKYALNYLPLTDFSIVSDDCDELYELIKKEFDVVIVGSDCVWQYVGYPFPNAYLLNFDGEIVKLSYAACAYRIDLSKMSDDNKTILSKAICSLNYIGIRDEQTKRIVENLEINKPFFHNCDPAFFVDLSKLPIIKENIKAKMLSAGIDFSKPIIGLQLRNRNISKRIKKTFGNDYCYVAIRERNNFADFFMENLSPFEWALIFSFFTFTITDYFHATLFSIKNEVCPIVFDNKTGFYNGEISRVEDLMKRMKLENCYVCYTNGQEQNINYKGIALNASQINIKDFKKRINQEVDSYASFKNFLKDCI